jgi:hypothetical protein
MTIMNSKQQAIAVELRKRCQAALSLNDGIPALIAMWTSEDMASIPDAGWAELAEFIGVTAAEALSAKNALNTLRTTMGDYGAGTLALYMIRLCGTVPHS